jgi:hypothetical protein
VVPEFRPGEFSSTVDVNGEPVEVGIERRPATH